MWMLDVCKVGVGVVDSYWFKTRAEAVAKKAELEIQYPDCGVLMQWEN